MRPRLRRLGAGNSAYLWAVSLFLSVVAVGRLAWFDAAAKATIPTEIACLHGSKFKYESRPRNCAFFARQYYPDGHLRRFRDIEGRRLNWTDWGAKLAVATGKFFTGEPLKVMAFDRVRCPDGGSSYGKVLITGRPGGGRGEFHLRLARCGSPRFNPFRFPSSTSALRLAP